MDRIVFNDLRATYETLKDEIDAAVAETLSSGRYILGEQTAAFEREFAAYCQTTGCVGVNSGTDAIYLALVACGIGPGDEVITVAHTAVASVAAIRMAGATPVLVDIDPATYTIDPHSLEDAITPAAKAVLPVHLYGHPADLDAVEHIARRRGLRIIEDCAQAHGAMLGNQRLGSIGDLACFSFYPTKNLGALGDGGAVTGSDQALLDRVRLLREYGWTPQQRYVSQIEGVNSRLDELQAAVLRVRLRHLDEQNGARRHLAALYESTLPPELVRPIERSNCRHVYHLYVVRVPQEVAERDQVLRHLDAVGVGAGIHYPVPVHRQPAYTGGQVRANRLPETERAADEVLSLPMYPTLSEQQVRQVAAALAASLKTNRPSAQA